MNQNMRRGSGQGMRGRRTPQRNQQPFDNSIGPHGNYGRGGYPGGNFGQNSQAPGQFVGKQQRKSTPMKQEPQTPKLSQSFIPAQPSQMKQSETQTSAKPVKSRGPPAQLSASPAPKIDLKKRGEAKIKSILKMETDEAGNVKITDANAEDFKDENGAQGTRNRKKFWSNIQGNKISKQELARRRNSRLGKILQPKNALKILHELQSGLTFDVGLTEDPVGHKCFQATVVVQGEQHKGIGRSKTEAKTAAAEAAIKYILKHHKLMSAIKSNITGNSDANGNLSESLSKTNEAMEMEGDESNVDGAIDGSGAKSAEPVLPWKHVASFALFKLLQSLDEDPNILNPPVLHKNAVPMETNGDETQTEKTVRASKQTKKLPPNAAEMNPVMLLKQMMPDAALEDAGQKGTAPNVIFIYKCTYGDEVFEGKGPRKKTAKNIAAALACQKLLNINYTSDLFGVTSNSETSSI